MNEGGASQPTPLVHDGIIYLVHTGNIVQALDGRDRRADLGVPRRARSTGGAMRNIAIYEDKLFVATTDARMRRARRAHRARSSGKRASPIATKGFSASSGPIVINGKVVQGLDGCDRFKEEGCFISAFDAETGKLLWRFNTVARPDEPGGDTWGKLPMMFRAGGETWITGSYDPDLNLTYWGMAQAKPWVPASRGMTALDKALYTSSTLALNPDTGKLVVALPARARRGARPRRGVRARARRRRRPEAGVHDRQARHPVEARSADRRVPRPQGNASSRTSSTASIRRPASPTYRGDILEAKIGEWITACPSTQGGHNWQAMSYHPGSSLLIIPLSQTLPGDRAAARSSSRKARAGRRPIAASSRCRAPTARSASSRPTTCGR